MFHKLHSRPLPQLLMTAVFVLMGCTPLIQRASTGGAPPTPFVPVITEAPSETPDTHIFFDLPEFQAALLTALEDGDTARMEGWMTDPVLTGVWRDNLSTTSPAEALSALFTSQLGADSRLALVSEVDLKALMGSQDPLSIPSSAAEVTDAFLVSGWGLDGRDEAILFVARQTDNSLKLHGWMVIRGGFSGARLGGVQFFENLTSDYSLYLPESNEVSMLVANQVDIIAPGKDYDHNRGMAWINVEPANGRTTVQVVEAVLVELGEGYNIQNTALEIETAQAIVLSGLPGQDSNRQLFMVHNDLLYHITFSPADPQAGGAYWQMEDIYAMVINTFHFTN